MEKGHVEVEEVIAILLWGNWLEMMFMAKRFENSSLQIAVLNRKELLLDEQCHHAGMIE